MLTFLLNYWKPLLPILFGVLLWGDGYWYGYTHEKKVVDEIKTSVAVESAKQQEKVNEIVANQQQVSKAADENYSSSLDAVRKYYRLHNGYGTCKVSSFPNTSSRTNESSSDQILIGPCAETTQQLISLQNWIRGQEAVK